MAIVVSAFGYPPVSYWFPAHARKEKPGLRGTLLVATFGSTLANLRGWIDHQGAYVVRATILGATFRVSSGNGQYSVNGILSDIPSSGIFRVVGGDLAQSLCFI